MGLDIRLPIGLMFALFGLILLGFGLTSGEDLYRKSLGINVNALWGGVLLVVGAVMLALARRAKPDA